MINNDTNILMIAGEHSGDSLGGELLLELRNNNLNCNYFGIGGNEMIAQGLKSLSNIEELNVMGFSRALLKYRSLKKIANNIVKECKLNNVKIAILIDYPGFNLELAKMLKKDIKDIKIIFYVSPQIWAWKFNRIFKIKQNVDLILLLFPFEKKIYDKYNIDNVVVGHQLMSKMKSNYDEGKEIITVKDSLVITLMPGSRTGEITRLLEKMLDTAVLIAKEYENAEFIIPNINDKEDSYIQNKIKIYQDKYNLKIQYQFHNSARSIEKADLVILASGTATLEVAYFKKPMIILYINSFITHFIGKRLLQIPYVGLVNILSEKFICKEFLQSDCNPKNIFIETNRILKDNSYREEMIKNVSLVKEGLGSGDSSKKSATAILKLISSL